MTQFEILVYKIRHLQIVAAQIVNGMAAFVGPHWLDREVEVMETSKSLTGDAPADPPLRAEQMIRQPVIVARKIW